MAISTETVKKHSLKIHRVTLIPINMIHSHCFIIQRLKTVKSDKYSCYNTFIMWHRRCWSFGTILLNRFPWRLNIRVKMIMIESLIIRDSSSHAQSFIHTHTHYCCAENNHHCAPIRGQKTPHGSDCYYS